MAWLVQPFDDEIHHLQLARRQAIEPGAQLRQGLLGRQLVEHARERAVDGGEQMRIVHRLLDEVLGAGLDGRDRHLHVGMAGDEDDRQGDVAAGKFAHQLDAVHAGHAHVGDDTAVLAAGESGR